MAKDEQPTIEKHFSTILARVSCGELLTDICKEIGVTRCEVYRWMNADVENRLNSYTRAREEQQHAWADDIVNLADRSRPGDIVTDKGDGTVEVKTADMVERTRLQIESRKWLMARLAPRTYGDKLDLNHSGEVKVGLLDQIRSDKANG